MNRGSIVGALGAAGIICGSALAQTNPPVEDPTVAMVGAWEFSNADRDKVCRFTFRADGATGGYKLDIDKNCPSIFPVTRDIVAWTLDNYGSLRLLDAAGNAIVELTEAEAGIFDGFEPGQGRYVLQAAAGATPVRSAEDMSGDWAFAHALGKPICGLTLANVPAGTDGLALKIKPGCDALIARFAPAAWRMDQGELLVVSARGQTWRFEENDANTWQRVPEGPDGLLLVRQQ